MTGLAAAAYARLAAGARYADLSAEELRALQAAERARYNFPVRRETTDWDDPDDPWARAMPRTALDWMTAESPWRPWED